MSRSFDTIGYRHYFNYERVESRTALHLTAGIGIFNLTHICRIGNCQSELSHTKDNESLEQHTIGEM